MKGDHVVYVTMAESSRPGLKMASRVGGHGCLRSTSIGKAIIASLSETELAALLEDLPQPRVTLRTLVDPDELRLELKRTRERGYAIDNEETEIGARCVGVPILDDADGPLAALSISGPAARIGDIEPDTTAERLWMSSREIASRLGYDATTVRTRSQRPRPNREA